MPAYRILRGSKVLVEAETPVDQLTIVNARGRSVLGIDIVQGMITLGYWPDGETWQPLAVLGAPDGDWTVLAE